MCSVYFFYNATATTEIYTDGHTLSLHDAVPSCCKQEDGVHYHARDVAVMRGRIEKFPVILASATPAIETRHQVELGRYKEIKLPSRFGGATMPEIEGIKDRKSTRLNSSH